jgi:hypothetical protein
MQFIVDESTGAAVVEFLRSLGHDVLAVAETIPQEGTEKVSTQRRKGAEFLEGFSLRLCVFALKMPTFSVLSQADDSVILNRATTEKRILITNDKLYLEWIPGMSP